MTIPAPPLAFLGLGGTEMIVIMLLVLIFFGGEKLPGFARGAGKAIREFKKAASGVEEEIKRAMEEPPPTRTPLPQVINPPEPDPTPGHQIMEHPLPLEPAGAAPTEAEAAPPASAATPSIAEISAAPATGNEPAAPKSELPSPDKPLGS